VQALAVGRQVAARSDKRLERRLDCEEPAVGEEALSRGVDAVRRLAEQKRLAAK
jgi:hypothetical protein